MQGVTATGKIERNEDQRTRERYHRTKAEIDRLWWHRTQNRRAGVAARQNDSREWPAQAQVSHTQVATRQYYG